MLLEQRSLYGLECAADLEAEARQMAGDDRSGPLGQCPRMSSSSLKRS